MNVKQSNEKSVVGRGRLDTLVDIKIRVIIFFMFRGSV